jgi:hypothetical protein
MIRPITPGQGRAFGSQDTRDDPPKELGRNGRAGTSGYRRGPRPKLQWGCGDVNDDSWKEFCACAGRFGRSGFHATRTHAPGSPAHVPRGRVVSADPAPSRTDQHPGPGPDQETPKRTSGGLPGVGAIRNAGITASVLRPHRGLCEKQSLSIHLRSPYRRSNPHIPFLLLGTLTESNGRMNREPAARSGD